jgi:hypothetical protein
MKSFYTSHDKDVFKTLSIQVQLTIWSMDYVANTNQAWGGI